MWLEIIVIYLYSWDIGNSLFRKGLIIGNRIIVYYLSFLLILFRVLKVCFARVAVRVTIIIVYLLFICLSIFNLL